MVTPTAFSSRFVFIVDDAELRHRIEHMTEAMAPVGLIRYFGEVMLPFLKRRATERFAQEGDSASGKWQALRPATQEIRAGNPQWGVGPAHPINKRTGELENYITNNIADAQPLAGLGAEMKYPGRPASGELFDKVKTAQRGNLGTPRTIMRPVAVVGAEDLLFFHDSLAAYIMGSDVTFI